MNQYVFAFLVEGETGIMLCMFILARALDRIEKITREILKANQERNSG